MITLKMPVIVQAPMLRMAMEVARRTGSEVRIETFFRVVDGEYTIDCDKESEARAVVELTAPTAPTTPTATPTETVTEQPPVETPTMGDVSPNAARERKAREMLDAVWPLQAQSIAK